MPYIDKRWSYRQITKETEEAIARLSYLAETHPSERMYYRAMAGGALALWSSIMNGWQDSGDRERLAKLVDAVGVPKPGTMEAAIEPMLSIGRR